MGNKKVFCCGDVCYAAESDASTSFWDYGRTLGVQPLKRKLMDNTFQ